MTDQNMQLVGVFVQDPLFIKIMKSRFHFIKKKAEQKTTKTNCLYSKIVLHNSSADFEISNAVTLVCHSIYVFVFKALGLCGTNTLAPHSP